MHRFRKVWFALAVLPALLTTLDAAAQAQPPVTAEGWEEHTRGLTFYAEVPMIDDREAERSGIGGNITAGGVGAAVRHADRHEQIGHVVFLMDTGGGSLYHAEAMEDVIDLHHQKTSYHIVVQNAISAGIWTAFSCDNIFICGSGTLGGATAYYQTDKGDSVVAGDIPAIAARLELTAKRNGHNPDIIKPLMHMPSELHVWRDEAGEAVLSNKAPKSREDVEGYRHLDRRNTVLTLTAKDAVDIGLAKPIRTFDAGPVGEAIGAQGWTRANRYGLVAAEIGAVHNLTRVMEDQWVRRKHQLDSVPVTTFNRNNQRVRSMLTARKKYEAVLTALRKINDALQELPAVHPERHVYLAGDGGKTVLADPDQWQADARKAGALGGQLNAGLAGLTKAYEGLQVDRRNIREISQPLRSIIARINGIKRYGNAAYWEKADHDD